MNRDLRGTSAPGQSHRRVIVAADHRGVDVAVPIDLGTAQEADFDPAVLEEKLEDVGHAADHQRAGHQGGVADGDGQPLGLGPDGAGLIDQHQARRVGRPGEIARQIGKPDPDEHDFAVAQLAGGDRRHHLARVCTAHPHRQYP